jgi:hypothetical protein
MLGYVTKEQFVEMGKAWTLCTPTIEDFVKVLV